MKTPYPSFLLQPLFSCLLVGLGLFTTVNTVHAQRKELNVHQADARFTVSAFRKWGVGSEEYYFYVQNKTSDEYRMVINVTLDLACVGTKTFVLGYNKTVYLPPNGKFDAFDDDWVHIYNSGADNFKDCRLKDGNSYTLYKGMSYQITSIENLTQKKAEEARKKEEEKRLAEEKKLEEKKALEAKKLEEERKREEAKLLADRKAAELEETRKKEEVLKQEAKKAETQQTSESKKATTTPVPGSTGTGEGSNARPTPEEQRRQEEEEKKIKEQEEAEQRQREAEEREEAERKRKEQEEKERLDRQREYYQQKDAERSQNTQSASEFGASALLVHYFIGQLIYSNTGEDSYMNVFKGDNYKVGFQAGYGFSSIPMFFNSSVESYDGNTYTYTDKVINQQSGTIDLCGGMEFWPLYGKKAGVGVFGQVGLGHGLLFQQFTAFGQGGLRAYAGFEKLKLFSEFSYGFRTVSVNSWIEPTELGKGKTSYNFQRLKIGPRFSFDSDFMGETKATLDILPVFELPDFRQMKYMTPLNIRWLNGLHLSLNFENRLQFFTEFFWTYQRSGEVEYGYADDVTFAGKYFRIGVLRNFDWFGDAALEMPMEKVRRFSEKKAHGAIMFFNPGFGWNKEQDNKLQIKKPHPGISFGYEQDFNILRNTNIATGIGIAFRNGGFSTSAPAGDTSQISYHSIMLQTALRTYLTPDAPQKYWVKYGLNHHIVLAPKAGGYLAASTDGSFRRLIPCLQLAGGIDFKSGPSGALRAGIQFERSLVYHYESSLYRVRSNQLSLQVGYVF